jgi:hypothetical protein
VNAKSITNLYKVTKAMLPGFGEEIGSLTTFKARFHSSPLKSLNLKLNKRKNYSSCPKNLNFLEFLNQMENALGTDSEVV